VKGVDEEEKEAGDEEEVGKSKKSKKSKTSCEQCHLPGHSKLKCPQRENIVIATPSVVTVSMCTGGDDNQCRCQWTRNELIAEGKNSHDSCGTCDHKVGYHPR
jgi:hypothetical protein